MIISSANRDRCSAVCAAAVRNSSAKSRSETESRLFAMGPSKPSANAVAARSIGKDVPASAAAPKGDWFNRLRQSVKRLRSRFVIS